MGRPVFVLIKNKLIKISLINMDYLVDINVCMLHEINTHTDFDILIRNIVHVLKEELTSLYG